MTEQTRAWAGGFGKRYTDRNALSLGELEKLYEQRHGVSRSDMNRRFLRQLDLNTRILEVGSNIGNQVALLQGLGFRDLMGVEIQEYALQLARKRTKGIEFIRGSALDLPAKEGAFGLVFTSGVLIHISPEEIAKAMAEIHRTSRRFIWGFEYYACEYEEVSYRDHTGLLWKADFARMYLGKFPDLRLVREDHLAYRDSENLDSMFLLEKVNRERPLSKANGGSVR